ncbi:MAG: hypothetical protein SGI92_08165 [Bryobacteraceae bacterium]|nr:hypothetical protein [Bryobacteraceae bacterium]
MRHSSDEDLVLHYYEELAEVGGHIDDCAECRVRYQALQRDMNIVAMPPVPERPAAYEEQLWARIAPKLGGVPAKPRWNWLRTRYWAPVTAAAAIAVLSFSLGRWKQTPVLRPAAVAEDSKSARERVLIVAVGDHLERSQMVIAELVNAKPGSTLNTERDLAESLVGPNRLYRQTAAMTGDAATVSLLEDIERVLLEVAHAPDEVRGEQVERLRQRIEQQGLLFRIRVTESQMQRKMGLPEQQTGRAL